MNLKEIAIYSKLIKKYLKATKEQQQYMRNETKKAIDNFNRVYEEMCNNMK
jgi:hypothetical protein